MKFLDFKLFYKHFVFVDKGNFDNKNPKRWIVINVFEDIVCASEILIQELIFMALYMTFLEVKFRIEKQEITHQNWCVLLFYAIIEL